MKKISAAKGRRVEKDRQKGMVGGGGEGTGL
jgi:hypothetical protein